MKWVDVVGLSSVCNQARREIKVLVACLRMLSDDIWLFVYYSMHGRAHNTLEQVSHFGANRIVLSSAHMYYTQPIKKLTTP